MYSVTAYGRTVEYKHKYQRFIAQAITSPDLLSDSEFAALRIAADKAAEIDKYLRWTITQEFISRAGIAASATPKEFIGIYIAVTDRLAEQAAEGETP